MKILITRDNMNILDNSRLLCNFNLNKLKKKEDKVYTLLQFHVYVNKSTNLQVVHIQFASFKNICSKLASKRTHVHNLPQNHDIRSISHKTRGHYVYPEIQEYIK